MPGIYYAPKPKYSAWKWGTYIAARFFFPPILLWDLLKYGVNNIFGEWSGSKILQAQGNQVIRGLPALTDETVQYYNQADLTCEKVTVITHDNAELDTIEIKHRSQADLAPKYQRYIVSFVGNSSCYEYELINNTILTDANALQANVIGFNFRGVGKSTGKAKSKDDLVTDGIAQVQRLLAQGVSPQNITLKGHSLGAGIATLVAKHFHHLEQPINLFNGRSFSSITDVAVGHIRLERDENNKPVGHKDSLFMSILAMLAKPFIKLGLELANWEINAGSAFYSIPEQYRDYVVVRSRKEQRVNRVDDAIIPHYASVHKALSWERGAKKAELDAQIAALDTSIQNGDLLLQTQMIEAKNSLIEARQKIKSDRKMEGGGEEDHNLPLFSLTNRTGKDAQTFFKDFVQRAAEHHAVIAPQVI